jgi:hypothetical protein
VVWRGACRKETGKRVSGSGLGGAARGLEKLVCGTGLGKGCRWRAWVVRRAMPAEIVCWSEILAVKY